MSDYRTRGRLLQRVQTLTRLPSLSGKVALVTGGTDGVGRAVVEQLASTSATVVLTARNATKGSAVVDEVRRTTRNTDVHMVELDLASLASVRTGAAAVLAGWDRLDVVICNAGIQASKERTLTVDGYEATFAVNHLGHALLLQLLRERVVASAPSTVVVVASEAHRRAGAGPAFEDPMFEHEPYEARVAYGRSKLANVMYARELSRRLVDREVRVVSAHPGGVDTPMMRQSLDSRLGRALYRVLRPTLLISPDEAAAGVLRVALDPALVGDGGSYYEKGMEHALKPYATDDIACRRLWDLTEELLTPA